MSDEQNIELGVQTFIDEFTRLETSTYYFMESTNEDWAKLNILALELSSYIPRVSDSTLFEIDDILYGDVSCIDFAGTRICLEDTVNYLVKNCYKTFYKAFFKMNGNYYHALDMVFLQLLELVSFDKHGVNVYIDMDSITDYMRPQHCLDRYLKVLKVMLYKPKECLGSAMFTFTKECINSQLWLLCIDEHLERPNSKRKDRWMSDQSLSILHKLQFNNYKDDLLYPCAESWKHGKVVLTSRTFIGLLISYINYAYKNGARTLGIKLSLKYFMSTQCEIQKIQLIHDFIYRIYGPFDDDPSYDDYPDLEYIGAIEGFRDDLMQFFDKFVINEVFRLFEVIISYPSIKLMKFVKYYGYDIGSWSYLPNDVTCSSYRTFKENTVELMNNYFGNPNNHEATYTSEKSVNEGEIDSCYHLFMRGLQLLDILYTVWLMLGDVISDSTSYLAYTSGSFRPEHSPIKIHCNNLIMNPSNTDRTHFALQVILRKCLFLILSHDDETHMENLIKFLSGKNIGQDVKEVLYLIINDY